MFSRSSRPLTTVFGIPLHVHWTAAITAVFIGLSAPALVGVTGDGSLVVGVAAALMFAISLLVHEYAHALVARRVGIGVRRVQLWALGGMAELESEPRRPGHELAVSIAGPLASLTIGGGAFAGAALLGLLGATVPSALLVWIGLMNLILGVFNLLPGHPLDGGRVLHSLVWWRTGDRLRAGLVTANAGRVVGALVIAFGFWSLFAGGGGLLTALVGWFILSSANAARALALQARGLRGRTAGDAARPVPPAVNSELTVDDFLTYWAPSMHPMPQHVLLVDGDRRAVGVVPTDAVFAVPHGVRERMPLSALAVGVEGLGVVSPATDLGEALAMSPSGYVLVSEPERLVGILTPDDLRPHTPEQTTVGAGAGA